MVLPRSLRWKMRFRSKELAKALLALPGMRLPREYLYTWIAARRGYGRQQAGSGHLRIDYEHRYSIHFFHGEQAKQHYSRERMVEWQRFLDSDERLVFPESEEARLTVLLVLYNRVELSYACLRSLLTQVHVPFRLLIVDNASSDGTSELLDRIDGARIVRNPDNLGFLQACNLAAEQVETEFLLFLNNDAVLLGDAVATGLSVLQADAGIGALGGKILLLDGSLQEAGSIVWRDGSNLGYGRNGPDAEPEYMFRRDVDYCSGVFLMVPTALFNRLGRFDPDYMPAYFEETDFCLRLHEQGYRVVYEPECVLLHYEFASSGSSDDAIELQKKHRAIFVEKHPEYLAGRPLPDVANILAARDLAAGRRILYIDDRVPHCYYGSGFPRSNLIVNTLVELGFLVTLYPLNFPAEDDWSSAYADIPREVEVMLTYGREQLSGFLRERQSYYSHVFISRPHNMSFFLEAAGDSRLREHCRIIYDAEAIFSLRDAVKHRLFTGREPKNLGDKIAAETSLAARADVVIAVSEGERAVFRQYLDTEVAVVGHALEVCPEDTPFAKRQGFLFVGNMDYDDSPNVDSMVWFVEEVFPLIRARLPDAELCLVGANASREIRRLASEHVHIEGRQEDLRGYYARNRVFLAPTRYAGGIPYKVHEAAARGIPVVASELVVEQLGWRHEQEILSAPVGDAESCAQQCIRLHQEAETWERVRSRAMQRVAEECSLPAVKRSLEAIFRC